MITWKSNAQKLCQKIDGNFYNLFSMQTSVVAKKEEKTRQSILD